MEGRPLPLHSCHFLSVVFTISMSFVSPASPACPKFECGNQTFGYPFGAKKSGCGDPAFQLECDHKVNMPLIDISGYQYYTVNHFDRHPKKHPAYPITIVDRNMWGDACNPSTSNHTMELWSSPQFHISDECINISLWGDCREDIREYMSRAPDQVYALECNSSWYYSTSTLDKYCKSSVRLPVQKFDRSNRPIFGSVYEGFKIKWSLSAGCKQCESKKERCFYDTSNSTKLSCKSRRRAGTSFGGAALMAALAVLCIWYVKKRRRRLSREVGGMYSNYQKNGMEANCHMIENLATFSYQELHQATNFFDEEKLLGGGGFGVVYLGELQDGRSVAVKRLYQDSSRSVEKFMNEVQLLSSLFHPNLVRLYGYSLFTSSSQMGPCLITSMVAEELSQACLGRLV